MSSALYLASALLLCQSAMAGYCENVPTVLNAQVRVNDGGDLVNASYTCLPGYVQRNNSFNSFFCLKRGGGFLAANCWFPPIDLSCDRVSCGEAPIVNNSIAINTSGGQGFEDIVDYNCSDGYTFSGAKSIQCLSTGEWSTTPTWLIADSSGSKSGPSNRVVIALIAVGVLGVAVIIFFIILCVWIRKNYCQSELQEPFSSDVDLEQI